MSNERDEVEDRFTASQRKLAESVRALLRRLEVSFHECLEGNRDEGWYRFSITPARSGLQVDIAVVGDVLVFEVNGIELRWEVEDFGGESEAWAVAAATGLAALFVNPLRLRLRRTVFGKETGAIWLPTSDGSGTWNGDRTAARGGGFERVDPFPWFLKAQGVEREDSSRQ